MSSSPLLYMKDDGNGLSWWIAAPLMVLIGLVVVFLLASLWRSSH